MKEKKLFNLFLLLSILEGIGAGLALLLIERDVKNIRFFGFSSARLALIAIILILLFLLVFLAINQSLKSRLVTFFQSDHKMAGGVKWPALFFVLVLWVSLWMPASRLGVGAAAYTRIQPFLIWLGLIGTQFYLYIKFIRNELNSSVVRQSLNQNKKLLITGGGVILLTFIVFVLLTRSSTHFSKNQLYFPPGAPLTSLQVFIGWILFALLFLLENQSGSRLFQNKWFTRVTFIVLWILTITLWVSTPLPCTDDRPGPFLPNHQCYPQINDAAYSIGSHYITLGQGIYHQWTTDKPLYMVFLAIGQSIFGPNINQYLLFQIILLALIPSLLFLIGRKMSGYFGGLFLAALSLTQETYSIYEYAQIGSVNVKLENPEILTGLLLILLCFAVYRWFTFTNQKIWAVLSGGLLGIATLVRFNALIIAPFILIAFLLIEKKLTKNFWTGLLLFILSLSIAFLPWFFTAKTANGSNYYVMKIQGVISSRIIAETPARQLTATVTQPAPTTQPTQTASNSESSPTVMPTAKATAKPVSTGLTYAPSTTSQGGLAGVVYHFMNNNFSSLAKLPTELLFTPIEQQVTGPIWNFDVAEPIWKENLSTANILALLLNLVIVVIGIVSAYKKYGMAGLSALIIQVGYYAGNAAAATSGGRYLEPAIWATLVYYVLGLIVLSTLVLSFLKKNFTVTVTSQNQADDPANQNPETKKIIAAFAGILLIGLSLPLANTLPNRLPAQSGEQVRQTAYSVLSKKPGISEDEWQKFTKDKKSLIVEGVAYHPRYYRSNFYLPGTPGFELMLLGKDNVFVSYMFDVMPTTYFSDGSTVILVGCKIADDRLWAARRTIMRTYAVIQIDHEKNLYFNESLPDCTK